jgi:hypothetical protein
MLSIRTRRQYLEQALCVRITSKGHINSIGAFRINTRVSRSKGCCQQPTRLFTQSLSIVIVLTGHVILLAKVVYRNDLPDASRLHAYIADMVMNVLLIL